jgi:hypothetical protein
MAKYVLVYRGGSRPQTDAEREAAMVAWGTWLGGLDAAVVDAGNPFGASTSVTGDGVGDDGALSSLSGYSVLTADSLASAAELAKGCPIIAAGGAVDVYETFEVM